MDKKLTYKMIKERCGTVSFKRGDSFYRAKKVLFEKYELNWIQAKVINSEEFLVTITSDEHGNIHTNCSCPSLASFHRDCQHIAAVLISIVESQRNGEIPLGLNNDYIHSNKPSDLSEGLIKIFNDVPIRSSQQQRHFETRQLIDVEFICKTATIVNGLQLVGVELNVGTRKIAKLRRFLNQIKNGQPSLISNTFTFDPTKHCFRNESNSVIDFLIQIVEDEKLFIDSLNIKNDSFIQEDLLFIPPSTWNRFIDLTRNAPIVKLVDKGILYEGISFSDDGLPIYFELKEVDNLSYDLAIHGMNKITLLNAYSTILFNGKLLKLKSEDFYRLVELNQMLKNSNTDKVHITRNQIELFMENVIPGLQKLGKVQFPDSLSKRFFKTPLIAKLYLDRVKNRLLAGLDFHYENIVINPLETREQILGTTVIRDEEKEYKILQLMEESSFSKTEGGYYLHNEELEYEFLRNIVPKLEKLVQIHATTAVRNRIFKESKKPQIRINLKKERTNWLEFKFELDIPENQIREVLLALKEKRKYYRLRDGTLFSLESRELAEINRFLKEVPAQEIDEESRLNVPIVRGFHLLDTLQEQSSYQLEDSFKQFLDSIQNPQKLEIEVPKPLQNVVRDYQVHGFKWMKTLANYGFGGILADDMGLGKTLQSITYIQSVLSDIRQKKMPILIVCPTALTYNWLNEFFKFTPHIEAVVADGSKSERGKLQKDLTDIDVLITSYGLLRNDIKWYEKQEFHTVFFDEAQNFKNPFTQTARVVKKIVSSRRFALTGTPVENSLEELWSIYHVVFPELFQGLKEYSNLPKKTIARRIRPFLLRRLKEDVLNELPEKFEMMETVELLPEQKKLYAAYLAKLRHDTLKHLANDKFTFGKNHIKILAGLTRLRQICCHPSLFIEGYKGSSAKFEQLLQIIEESKLSGRRVLIFSQFTKMLNLIGRELALRGEPYFYLDGQTSSEDRLSICNRFNQGERDLFLISLKAGGVGLNLTGADTVILYDSWWNPAVEKQAADRAHRFGQTKDVQVIKLVARGTIEEKMNELQEKKRKLIGEIIESNEKNSTSLTEEDIREILMI